MREMTVGTVQIASVPTLADNLLSPTIAEFQKSWPHIQISVFTVDNHRRLRKRRAGSAWIFGLGLSPLHHRDGRMVKERISDVCAAELVCVVHPDSPLAARVSVTPADLAPYPLISFGKTQPLGALIEDSFRRAGVVRRIAMEVTLTSVACSLARSGAGAAIIDPFHLWAPRDHGVVTLRYQPSTEVKAQMLLPNNTPLSRSAQLFVAALRRIVRERGAAVPSPPYSG